MKSHFDTYYREKMIRTRCQRAMDQLISFVCVEDAKTRRITLDILREMADPGVGPNEYRCAICKEVFEKAWSDEDAQAERVGNGWASVAVATVCDDCYKPFVKEP
jgi:uncharacterized protein with PIN domain